MLLDFQNVIFFINLGISYVLNFVQILLYITALIVSLSLMYSEPCSSSNSLILSDQLNLKRAGLPEIEDFAYVKPKDSLTAGLPFSTIFLVRFMCILYFRVKS